MKSYNNPFLLAPSLLICFLEIARNIHKCLTQQKIIFLTTRGGCGLDQSQCDSLDPSGWPIKSSGLGHDPKGTSGIN